MFFEVSLLNLRRSRRLYYIYKHKINNMSIKRMQELAGVKSNKSSIDWLVSQLPLGVKGAIMDKIEQAKEMHQSEIEEAFYSGNQIPGNWEDDSTNYYNDTFK